MSEHRSNATKVSILQVARDLFAEHGVNAVSVRNIAAAAGISHTLVHLYFGTKEELFAAILKREVDFAAGMAVPSEAGDDPHTVLRRMMRYYLTDGRSTIRLFTQAELAGLEPEKMLEGELRPLAMLSRWIGDRQSATGPSQAMKPDPALASATIGAALFSFAVMSPWLMTAVGLKPEDFEDRLEEIVDILMAFVTAAVGLELNP